jgi:hypothetical protein
MGALLKSVHEMFYSLFQSAPRGATAAQISDKARIGHRETTEPALRHLRLAQKLVDLADEHGLATSLAFRLGAGLVASEILLV